MTAMDFRNPYSQSSSSPKIEQTTKTKWRPVKFDPTKKRETLLELFQSSVPAF